MNGRMNMVKKSPSFVVDWNTYFEWCNQLVRDIKKSGVIPTCIVGISRGGLIPANYIAYKLGIRKVYSIGMTSYEGEKQGDLAIYQGIGTIFNKKTSILIVDDIADTGNSLLAAIDHIKNGYSHDLYTPNIRTATLVYKPSTSKHKPDFYSISGSADEWVIFPYEE